MILARRSRSDCRRMKSETRASFNSAESAGSSRCTAHVSGAENLTLLLIVQSSPSSPSQPSTKVTFSSPYASLKRSLARRSLSDLFRLSSAVSSDSG